MIYKNRYIFYLILLLSGCGFYSFKGSTPTGISSICLIPITNNTSDFTLSNLINEKLYDELLNQNVYNMSDIYNSDSSLEIEIDSVEDQLSDKEITGFKIMYILSLGQKFEGRKIILHITSIVFDYK